MDINSEKLREDFCELLGFSQQFDRDWAMVLLAHVLVINFCRRRATLDETLHDVDSVFDQITQLVKWNFETIRSTPPDGDLRYHFNDPAICGKPEGTIN